jgi:hypothetical protein
LLVADKALARAEAEIPASKDERTYNRLVKARLAAVTAARRMIAEAVREGK